MGTGGGKATGRILGWTKGSGRPGGWGVTTSMKVSGRGTGPLCSGYRVDQEEESGRPRDSHPEDEGADQSSGCVDKLRRADVKKVYGQHPRSPHTDQKVAKIPAEPKKKGLHVRQQGHFLTQPSTALGLPSNHVHTASKSLEILH